MRRPIPRAPPHAACHATLRVGRLDPELVLRVAGQATLLKAASEPPKDQRRLLAGAPGGGVPVAAIIAAQLRLMLAPRRPALPADQARPLGADTFHGVRRTKR